MAKKAGKRGKRSGKSSKKKAGKRGKGQSEAKKVQKKKNIARRLELHRAASMLKDFHGGKGPVKSGCGRPRGS